eukprot:TRINITY_DN36070_c0_g1_i1.p1 TRINITY_DN36070_c0_g1~~TRINITY_DN36070_c0_g1_i1.p1  ORF type:complete len:569 (-),score=64.10 TRINITY_DN36070_c0_g1_i1:999-2705(-)
MSAMTGTLMSETSLLRSSPHAAGSCTCCPGGQRAAVSSMRCGLKCCGCIGRCTHATSSRKACGCIGLCVHASSSRTKCGCVGLCAHKLSGSSITLARKSCACVGRCIHGSSGSSYWSQIKVQGGRKVTKTKAVKTTSAATEKDASDTVLKYLNVDYLDRDKVDGMQWRRVVFTPEDWMRHRSSGRHLRHLTTIPSSRIITSLAPPVLSMAAIATAVVAVNTAIGQHILPDWFPVLHINPLPLSLTASALGFLLVFRTNASYGRFDEARKMIGLMLNRVRDTTRLCLSYVARDQYEHEKPILMQMIRHLQAFPLAYKHHFVFEGTLEADLRENTALTEEEIQGVLTATHRPNYVLQMCSECLRTCHVEPALRLNIDTNLATFADDIGGSERIYKTPIPVSYTRLTSRFLVVWHMFLPFALWDSCNVLTIPATMITAAVFFCIEEVGVLIEEPFSILAMSAISATARNNVAELVKLHDGMKSLVVPALPVPGHAAPKTPPPPPKQTAEEKAASEAAVAELAAAVAALTATASITPKLPTKKLDLLEQGAAIRTEAPAWTRSAVTVNRNME